MGLSDLLNRRAALNAAVTGAAANASPPAPPATPAPAPTAAPTAAPTPTAPPAGAAVTPAAVSGAAPTNQAPKVGYPNAVPWANPSCGACKGLGWNTAGLPCRICVINAPKNGKPLPDAFDMTPTGDGNIYWQSKTDPNINGTSPMSASAGVTVATSARVEKPATPADTPTPAPAAVTTPTPASTPAATPAPATPPVVAPPEPFETIQLPPIPDSKPGKDRIKSFILVVNAAVVKAPKARRGVVRMPELFQTLSETLAADYIKAGKLKAGESYWDIDAFERREEMSKAAESIAEMLGSDYLTVDLDNATPDVKQLVEALRPFANNEIVGI